MGVGSLYARSSGQRGGTGLAGISTDTETPAGDSGGRTQLVEVTGSMTALESHLECCTRV